MIEATRGEVEKSAFICRVIHQFWGFVVVLVDDMSCHEIGAMARVD